MKKRIGLLVGLTAVFLLILLTSCTTPTIPEAIVETAVPATPTSQPTATTSTGSVQATAPTATPEPTATPTAAEQANQRLLNDGRFTTLLDELTQEIGRDLSDDEQAQVLALARALWLPDQTDASDWRPDPASVTLHWRPALDGREGPVVRVVEAQPDSPYAAGAVIFWQAERLLSLTPSQPGFNIEYTTIHKNGRSLSTWIETDVNGELIRFVDNANPDSPTYYKWVNPQDLREDGTFTIYIIQDTDPRNGDAGEFWWTNGGEPVRITSAPPDANDGESFADYLNRTNKSIQTMTFEGKEYLVIIDAAGLQAEHRYNHDTGEWEEYVMSATRPLEYVNRLNEEGVTLISTNITVPGFDISLPPSHFEAQGNPYAVIMDVDQLVHGINWWKNKNSTNNAAAIRNLGGDPSSHSLFPVMTDSGEVQPQLVPHDSSLRIHVLSGLEPTEVSLPFRSMDNPDWQWGAVWDEENQELVVMVRIMASESNQAGHGFESEISNFRRVLQSLHILSWNVNDLLRAPHGDVNTRAINTSGGMSEIMRELSFQYPGGTHGSLFREFLPSYDWSEFIAVFPSLYEMIETQIPQE